MPLFALPLSTSIQPSSATRVHFTSRLPTRKRKRASSSSTSSTETANPTSALTNPYSLTPDEIVQYRLAGLEIDRELPSEKGVGDWPHRGLEREKRFFDSTVKGRKIDRKGKGRAGEEHTDDNGDEESEKRNVEEETTRQRRGPKLRFQHLSVLTAILQRCLLEGDIQRASRAWAMLIRVQVAGRGVDIRGSGYWGIGAELLMRSFNRGVRNKFSRSSDSNSEDEDEERGEGNGERRWGSKEGFQKAKDYFERLIIEYPYKRWFHGSVGALDFWPAMVACEIYGIQYEQKAALARITEAEERDDDEGSDSGSEIFEDAESHIEDEEGDDSSFIFETKRKAKLRKRKAEKIWRRKEEVRQTTLAAAEQLAARMDDQMAIPPFDISPVMFRLRGMLALYVGDLSVPAMPVEDEDEEDIGRRGARSKEKERRFLFRQRINDHERGKKRREEQLAKAMKSFERMARESGEVIDIKDPDAAMEEPEDLEEMYDAED